MCFKKEYKCYKGKDSEDCCQKRVDEAVAHRTNFLILIIAIALIIVALTVKTANNTEFVGQVSFASTVTSIVLSVIAIWMSITGERSTNEIKDKVSNSVDKLNDTTNMSFNLTKQLEDMLDSQSIKYESIRQKMEEVIYNIQGMKASFDLINSSFDDEHSNGTDEYLDENSLKKMVKNVFNAFKTEEVNAIKDAIKFVYNQLEEKDELPIKDVYNYLCLNLKVNGNDAMLISGILITFSRSGVFRKLSKEKINL